MEVQQVSWNTWPKEKGQHSAVHFTTLLLDAFAVIRAHLYILYRRPKGETPVAAGQPASKDASSKHISRHEFHCLLLAMPLKKIILYILLCSIGR